MLFQKIFGISYIITENYRQVVTRNRTDISWPDFRTEFPAHKQVVTTSRRGILR